MKIKYFLIMTVLAAFMIKLNCIEIYPMVSFGLGRTNLKEDHRMASVGNLSIYFNEYILSGQLKKHYKIDLTGDRQDYRQTVVSILAGRKLIIDENSKFYISAETGYSWIKQYDYVNTGEIYNYEEKITRKTKIPLKISFIKTLSNKISLRFDSLWGFGGDKTYNALVLSFCLGDFNFLYEDELGKSKR